MQKIQLYEEVSIEDPAYVPRKFREDKRPVHSQEELDIVSRQNMNNLQCEIDILKLRKEYFETKIEEFDDFVQEFANGITNDDLVRKQINKIWKDDTSRSEQKTNEEWKKKIAGMKEAYQTDKIFIISHNQDRISQSQTPSTINGDIELNTSETHQNPFQNSDNGFQNEYIQNAIQTIVEHGHDEMPATDEFHPDLQQIGNNEGPLDNYVQPNTASHLEPVQLESIVNYAEPPYIESELGTLNEDDMMMVTDLANGFENDNPNFRRYDLRTVPSRSHTIDRRKSDQNCSTSQKPSSPNRRSSCL